MNKLEYLREYMRLYHYMIVDPLSYLLLYYIVPLDL